MTKMPHTSNMRIRTVPGQGATPDSASSARCHRAAPEGQLDKSRAVPIEPPGRRTGGMPSTHDQSSNNERSGRQVRRSRRWFQLRTTTTRKPNTLRAKTASEEPHEATTDDVGPERDPRSTDAPHGGLRETVLTKQAEDPRRSPVEAGPKSAGAAQPDPLSLLVELAMLPSRMVLAATAETVKLLVPDHDDRPSSAREVCRDVATRNQRLT
jgi:hypothetical protein